MFSSLEWNSDERECNDIERIQKRVLAIIYLKYDYDQLLQKSGLKTLKERWDDLCIVSIKNTSMPSHRLHSLLKKNIEHESERDTRTNSERYYNYMCRTEIFKNSPIVFAIDHYNLRLNES